MTRQVQFPPAIQELLEKGYELRIRLVDGKIKLHLHNAGDYETENPFALMDLVGAAQREMLAVESGRPSEPLKIRNE